MDNRDYERIKAEYHSLVENYKQRVKDACDIVEIASLYTKPHRRGQKYIACCVFHQERNPSMEIDPGKGLCHCYSCGAGGDVFSIVQKAEQCTFREAVDMLARHYGVIEPIPFADYLKSQTDAAPTYSKPNPTPAPIPIPTPKKYAEPERRFAIRHISQKQLESTEKALRETTLYKWMHGLFGDEVDLICRQYHVGGCEYWPTEHGKASSFPLINICGNIVDCQLSPFNPNGHGISNGKRKVKSYALYQLLQKWIKQGLYPDDATTQELRDKWPYFGEHLLPGRPLDEVAICEAPKTALLGTLLFPQFVWIAAMNKSLFTQGKLDNSILLGRKISLFPDKDGISEWTDTAKRMAGEGYDIGIYDLSKIYECEEHDDLADIIERTLLGKQEKIKPRLSPDEEIRMANRREAELVFAEICRESPSLSHLAEVLSLEAISIEYA